MVESTVIGGNLLTTECRAIAGHSEGGGGDARQRRAYRLGGAVAGAGAVFFSFGCFFFSLSFGLLSPIGLIPFRKVHGAVGRTRRGGWGHARRGVRSPILARPPIAVKFVQRFTVSATANSDRRFAPLVPPLCRTTGNPPSAIRPISPPAQRGIPPH